MGKSQVKGGKAKAKPPAPAAKPGPVPADEPAQPSSDAAPIPALRPFQADALLSGILGADVDLGQFGTEDAKSVVASIVGVAPTVASLNKRRPAAE